LAVDIPTFAIKDNAIRHAADSIFIRRRPTKLTPATPAHGRQVEARRAG
jgi:hypothetical protein